MNWMGGARSRVKFKDERKIQQEFFDRKRLEMSGLANVRASKKRKLSQDLLALHTVNRTHSTYHGENLPGRKTIKKLDLDKFKSCTKPITDVDLGPCSPNTTPSKLLINESRQEKNSSCRTSVSALINHKGDNIHSSSTPADNTIFNISSIETSNKSDDHIHQKSATVSSCSNMTRNKTPQTTEFLFNKPQAPKIEKKQKQYLKFDPFVSEDFQTTPLVHYHSKQRSPKRLKSSETKYCNSVDEGGDAGRYFTFQHGLMQHSNKSYTSTPAEKYVSQHEEDMIMKKLQTNESFNQVSPIFSNEYPRTEDTIDNGFQFKPRLMGRSEHSKTDKENIWKTPWSHKQTSDISGSLTLSSSCSGLVYDKTHKGHSRKYSDERIAEISGDFDTFLYKKTPQDDVYLANAENSKKVQNTLRKTFHSEAPWNLSFHDKPFYTDASFSKSFSTDTEEDSYSKSFSTNSQLLNTSCKTGKSITMTPAASSLSNFKRTFHSRRVDHNHRKESPSLMNQSGNGDNFGSELSAPVSKPQFIDMDSDFKYTPLVIDRKPSTMTPQALGIDQKYFTMVSDGITGLIVPKQSAMASVGFTGNIDQNQSTMTSAGITGKIDLKPSTLASVDIMTLYGGGKCKTRDNLVEDEKAFPVHEETERQQLSRKSVSPVHNVAEQLTKSTDVTKEETTELPVHQIYSDTMNDMTANRMARSQSPSFSPEDYKPQLTLMEEIDLLEEQDCVIPDTDDPITEYTDNTTQVPTDKVSSESFEADTFLQCEEKLMEADIKYIEELNRKTRQDSNAGNKDEMIDGTTEAVETKISPIYDPERDMDTSVNEILSNVEISMSTHTDTSSLSSDTTDTTSETVQNTETGQVESLDGNKGDKESQIEHGAVTFMESYVESTEGSSFNPELDKVTLNCGIKVKHERVEPQTSIKGDKREHIEQSATKCMESYIESTGGSGFNPVLERVTSDSGIKVKAWCSGAGQIDNQSENKFEEEMLDKEMNRSRVLQSTSDSSGGYVVTVTSVEGKVRSANEREGSIDKEMNRSRVLQSTSDMSGGHIVTGTSVEGNASSPSNYDEHSSEAMVAICQLESKDNQMKTITSVNDRQENKETSLFIDNERNRSAAKVDSECCQIFAITDQTKDRAKGVLEEHYTCSSQKSDKKKIKDYRNSDLKFEASNINYNQSLQDHQISSGRDQYTQTETNMAVRYCNSSTSPIQKEDTSTLCDASTSPLQKADNSTMCDASTSPIQKTDNSTMCEASTSPIQKADNSTMCDASTSPIQKTDSSTLYDAEAGVFNVKHHEDRNNTETGNTRNTDKCVPSLRSLASGPLRYLASCLNGKH